MEPRGINEDVSRVSSTGPSQGVPNPPLAQCNNKYDLGSERKLLR